MHIFENCYWFPKKEKFIFILENEKAVDEFYKIFISGHVIQNLLPAL